MSCRSIRYSDDIIWLDAEGRRHVQGSHQACESLAAQWSDWRRHLCPSMIISHLHEFIFVPVPKTGTHSVRQALRRHLGPDDLEQVRLFTDKRFPYAELAAVDHGHLSIAQVRPHVGSTIVERYFKFAFVRNPFDRFVSYCAFMTRQHGGFLRDPQGTMHRYLFESRPTSHVHFQSQASLLTDEQGRIEVDFIGRVENMQASYDMVCRKLGLPSQTLDKINSSTRSDYRQYYDASLIKGVTDLYREDLALFGYAF
jgi:hypothetical protein